VALRFSLVLAFALSIRAFVSLTVSLGGLSDLDRVDRGLLGAPQEVGQDEQAADGSHEEKGERWSNPRHVRAVPRAVA
jgi:hypothetical protein